MLLALVNASCAAFGCNISYDPAHSCQCNAAPDGGCAHFKNCCADYAAVCGAGPPPPPPAASCAVYGCVYNKAHKCQCNDQCKAHGDCCSDWKAHCSKPGPGPPPPPTPGGHPDFDHQTKPYTESFQPTSVASGAAVTLTPFFSPDSSAKTIVDFVDAVPKGGKLDIGTPSFGSWSGLTPFSGCTGGSAANCSAEKFPVFQAILNAVHQRDVSVRLLTNNFNAKVCAGKVDPLSFLALNGVAITWYATTTFMHAKFMASYPRKSAKAPSRASISSVNWSHNSYVNDREAGAIVEGAAAAPLLAFTVAVFASDLAAGVKFKPATYPAADMKVITSKAKRTPVISTPPSRPYVSPAPKKISASGGMTVYTSPDYALKTLQAHIAAATKSFDLYMYQITEKELTASLLAAKAKGVKVRILVSHDIYGKADAAAAQKQYAALAAGGLTIMLAKSFSFADYQHQKYWVVDGDSTGLSTGNWSPSDYPSNATAAFEPYPSNSWRSTNRDYTIKVDACAEFAAVYLDVLEGDLKTATTWKPKAPMN